MLTEVAGVPHTLNTSTMSVKWKPPVVSLRNSYIQTYKFEYMRTDSTSKPSGKGSEVRSHTGGSSDIQMFQQKGLAAFKDYNFSVSACSDSAAEVCGPPLSKVAKTPQAGYTVCFLHDLLIVKLCAAPGPPTIVEVTAKSSTSIQIKWKPPNDENINGVLVQFTIYMQRTTEPFEKKSKGISDTSMTEYTITGLNKYTLYQFEMSATTTVSTGALSLSVEIRTLQDC